MKPNAAKLTADDVRLIRQLHEWKEAEKKRLDSIASIQALAEKFDVSPGAVEKVLRYETWINVR